jgi:hypothetical protein
MPSGWIDVRSKSLIELNEGDVTGALEGGWSGTAVGERR